MNLFSPQQSHRSNWTKNPRTKMMTPPALLLAVDCWAEPPPARLVGHWASLPSGSASGLRTGRPLFAIPRHEYYSSVFCINSPNRRAFVSSLSSRFGRRRKSGRQPVGPPSATNVFTVEATAPFNCSVAGPETGAPRSSGKISFPLRYYCRRFRCRGQPSKTTRRRNRMNMQSDAAYSPRVSGIKT